MSSWVVDILQEIPDLLVSDDPSDLQHYGQDWTRQWPPNPCLVAFPSDYTQVQALVRFANQRCVALVPSGGRTGLSGGAVAANGEIVVSLSRLNRILDFDEADRVLTVQAGVVTEVVQNEAAARSLYYPVDFGSRGSSQIGGNVATNAGGIKVLRYGMTRDWVAGMKVVTGTGELLELNRNLVKNATGYDFRHLMIGSEGTLGIIVEVSLRLAPQPPAQQVMLLAVAGREALMPVLAGLRERLDLSAFEFFTDKALRHVLAAGSRKPFESQSPCYVLAEFDAVEGLAETVFSELADKALVTDGVIAQSSAQAVELWRLREGITESISSYTPYKNDISVRISRIEPFMTEMEALFAREYPDFEVIWFGHLGDGNLHISVLKPKFWQIDAFSRECGRVTELLADCLARYEGSISAEHGVGLLKKPYLDCSRSTPEIVLMRQIKHVFDPNGILNPGKLVDFNV
jgi:FAD/FMN-containing dehydrogenase